MTMGSKTFLKEWINAVSKFIAIIPCRSNCQILFVFMSFTKRTLPSFKSREAGYELVYYGINNKRPI